MDGATVTATGVAEGGSALYLYDDRLSFKYATEGPQTTIQIDQPADEVKDFQFLALIDHNCAGGTAVVKTYPSDARLTPTAIISGTVGSEDPYLFDAGSVQSGKQYLDVELDVGTGDMSIGELGLFTKFDSPRAPLINVSSKLIPNRTYIDLPNGERRSIRHAEPARVKSYRVSGLSRIQAESWLQIYGENEGIKLVLLTDDEDETYPAIMDKALSKARELNLYSVELDFTEVPV